MSGEWRIQSRTDRCSATGRPFHDGEYFYTVLYKEAGGFRREDLCEAAWKERRSAEPFSFWRSKFEAAPAPEPEAIGKQTAEDLLRASESEAVRYILALMLERKRVLKEVDVRAGAPLTRIYQHGKTGEVFVITDPGLRLDQIAELQAQVAERLG